MVNNIKTEVIYYSLPTDFEFEFNLCGSCQMRLLTSTASDRTTLLKALQRSISRSRVIIIIGDLKGENGIINLISKSIGYPCEKIDNNIYDIEAADDIMIIKDSVPLITDGGEFGGCIIESGPQSMIFLSEDKKIRKEIMTSLVYGYIKDLSTYPIQAAAKTEAPTVEETPVSTEVIEEIPEPQDTAEVPVEITEEIPEEVTEEVTEEPQEIAAEEPKVIDTESDPFNINNLFTNADNQDIDFEDSDSTVYEDDDYEDPKQNRYRGNKALDIATLILSVILLATLAFVVYSYIYLPLTNGVSIGENFRNVFGFLLN